METLKHTQTIFSHYNLLDGSLVKVLLTQPQPRHLDPCRSCRRLSSIHRKLRSELAAPVYENP